MTTTTNPQIPVMPTAGGGRCVMHLSDGTSYAFHCDTNRPYTETPTIPTVETMPPGRPPSAGLPEVAGTLPRTGTDVEPVAGVAGFLIVVGIPLVLVAGWRRWKENRHLAGLARIEADRRRNGTGA